MNSRETSFRNSKFLEEVSFSGSKFQRAAFDKAEFSGDASFRTAEFSRLVSFRYTKFLKNVVFHGAQFSRSAMFSRAKFLGNASFTDSKFSSLVSFRGCEFSSNAIFRRTQFSGDSIFHETRFKGPTHFDGSKIIGLVTFWSTFFQTKEDQILSSPIEKHTSFDEIKVDRGGEVRFEGGTCMSRVSLHHADIGRFSFLDVRWGRLGGRASVMEHGILEERKRRSKDAELALPDITPEHVHQIYVRLRRNLERSAGRYPEAGDFFINEKEMRKLILQEGRRWPPPRNLPEWSILKLYAWLALYGESIMRPVTWGVVAVFVFAALRMVPFVLQTIDSSFNLQTICRLARLFPDFVMQSVMAFFQMRSEPGLDILERLISVPILGSLFIALKRKFERR